MKTRLLLILFVAIFFANSVSAQPYQSIFGEHSTEWVFHWFNLAGEFNDTIRVTKDSVIENKTYKILEVKDYRIALREDLDSGKVWGRSLKGSHCEDELAFDFHLQAGDTFQSNIYPFSQYPESARIIDSVKYINGLKYLYTHTPYYGETEPITFIEGIGSNMATTLIFCEFGNEFLRSYLLCSYKDGQQTPYRNRYFDGKCHTFTNVKDLASYSNDIILYPQPAKDNLFIRNNTKSKITRLNIINDIGQSMIKPVVPTSSGIDIHGLCKGYYFVSLELENGHRVTKPVVIR